MTRMIATTVQRVWRFDEDVIEDLAMRTLHRIDCPEIDTMHPLDGYPAGSSISRAVPPRGCWLCKPALTPVTE